MSLGTPLLPMKAPTSGPGKVTPPSPTPTPTPVPFFGNMPANQPAPGTPKPSTAPPLNPYGVNGNPAAPGWQSGRTTTNDPWYQAMNAQQAIADAQYNQQQSSLQQQLALAEQAYKRGGGGSSAAYNFGMQYLGNDRARLAADQALSAQQRAFAATNRDQANSSQTRALMSDAVSRGATDAAGVNAGYGDITSKNDLNYKQAIAQADRNDAYLAALAKDYGIKESELKSALGRGSAAYGLDYARTIASITDAMNSADLERRAAGVNTLMQLIQAGVSVPASAFQQYGAGYGSTGSTGGGTGSPGTKKQPVMGGSNRVM